MKIEILHAGHPNWNDVADFAAVCSWRAGAFLADLMHGKRFTEWERVIVAFSDDRPVGFCTLTSKDEMPESCAFTPFIGFVFVDENHRGQRISERMIDAAAAYAGSLGFDAVYVTSDEQRLYEKYGFTRIGMVETIRKERTQLFMKSTKERRKSLEPRALLDILHIAERLKDTPRHCTTSKRRTESVAEHCWRVSLMALLLAQDSPEIDMDRVIRMCLIHDLGECFTGDIPTFLKTDSDRRNEDVLLREWLLSLPSATAGELTSLFDELDAQITPEARFCKALDKLEALIQHNESPLDTWAENEYALNRTYAFDTVSFSDKLTELRKEILADTIKKINDRGEDQNETT